MAKPERHRAPDEQALQLLADDAQLIDVLPDPEYSELHLPGAIDIPLKQLDRESTAQQWCAPVRPMRTAHAPSREIPDGYREFREMSVPECR